MQFDGPPEARLFGPKQISHMTGLAMDGQRNWRHRGHLDPSEGPRGKMSTFPIAALAVRAWASFLGYPVSESRELGQKAAPSVVFYALLHEPDGWDPINVIGTRKAIGEFNIQFGADLSLATEISGLGEGMAFSRITWRDHSEPELEYEVVDDPATSETVALRQLNLAQLGVKLAEAARSPLFDIRVRSSS